MPGVVPALIGVVDIAWPRAIGKSVDVQGRARRFDTAGFGRDGKTVNEAENASDLCATHAFRRLLRGAR